jgi:hypothetical protein
MLCSVNDTGVQGRSLRPTAAPGLASIAAFLGQWSANALLEALVARAVGGEILARSFQTERAIRATSDNGGVLIVLTVILPEAHLADIEPTAFLKGQEATTRACPPFSRRRGPNNGALIESPNVSIKPPPTSLKFLG